MGKITPHEFYVDVVIEPKDMAARLTPLLRQIYAFAFDTLVKKAPLLAEGVEFGAIFYQDGKFIGRFYRYPGGKDQACSDAGSSIPLGYDKNYL